jgi:hypothetical protein
VRARIKPGRIAQGALVAVRFGIQEQESLAALGGAPEPQGAVEDPTLERLIETGQAIGVGGAHAAQIVYSPPTLMNQRNQPVQAQAF